MGPIFSVAVSRVGDTWPAVDAKRVSSLAGILQLMDRTKAEVCIDCKETEEATVGEHQGASGSA